MAQPAGYQRQANFTSYQTNNPGVPMSGGDLDSEFNALKKTLDQTLTNIALLQRDDGQQANNSIGRDQLLSELLVGISQAGNWVTATPYKADQIVWQNNAIYRNILAHTSTVFATDLAAGKWFLLIDFSVPVNTTNANATSTAADVVTTNANVVTTNTNKTAALASANNAANSETNALVSKNNAAASANAANTSATAAALSETNAKASALAAASSASGGVIFTAPLTAGTSTNYTATLGLTAYVIGTLYRVRLHLSNTASSTLNLDGLGVVTIKTKSGFVTHPGELNQNRIAEFYYDGTNFIILNPAQVIATWTPELWDGTYGTNVPTYQFQYGTYRLKDDEVTLYANIKLTGFGALNTADTLYIGKVPLRAASLLAGHAFFGGASTGMNLTAGQSVHGQVYAGSETINLQVHGGVAGIVGMFRASLSTTANLQLTGSYLRGL